MWVAGSAAVILALVPQPRAGLDWLGWAGLAFVVGRWWGLING